MALLLVLFAAIFDWNWLRGTVERYASESMGRSVTIGALDVRMHRLVPRVVLSDVTLGNPEWAGNAPMGRARELMFSVRLPTLLMREIVVPHLRLTDADVAFLRDAEGRANWRFSDTDEPGRRSVKVLTLTLDDARVAYRDAVNDLTADLHGFTHDDGRYKTRIGFAGRWRDGSFEGTADTGSVLSLRGSSEPFPMRIGGWAGSTKVNAEGEVADITRFRHIDADFAISGPTLASLYEPLRLALPDTPPYEARGRLKRDGDTYLYENFKGKIGASDIAGSAKYELRQPRPFLTADLQSGRLDVADLGPVVGLESDARGNRANGRKQERAAPEKTRATSSPASTASSAGGRLFPDTPFNLRKLNSMDADVRIAAHRLRFPKQVPLHDFATRARLEAGVLTLEPLKFGFAGGDIVAKIVLDAADDPLTGRVDIDFKRVKLAELFPTLDKVNQSGGSLGAQIRLAGRGNSVAALLGSADGSVMAGMAGGRVSELAVWLVNLHGGELIPLLFGGDRPTPVRCGAAALDVKNGIGSISLFVFDTEESRITGSGGVDLRNERLDVTLRPEAKKPGLLSIRGPIRIHGELQDPDFAVAPQSIARGLGALALGAINPILALLPLIETGPGEDTNCQQVLQPVEGAVQQSGGSIRDAPASRDETRREGSAPIVNVPPGKVANGDSERPAPIVDVPAKK